MADEKRVGKGTQVKVDEDGNLTFTKIGLMKDVTPPPRERKGADDTELDAELETEAPGVEALSEFTFNQFYHAGSTNQQIIDTLFDAGEDGIVNWQIVYPYSTPVTKQFPGWVKKVAEETVVKDSVMSREVTVSRRGPITYP